MCVPVPIPDILKNFMKPHIELAHSYWSSHLKPGNNAIDATCGNGHDSLALAQILGTNGALFCYDIQPQAIQNTRKLVEKFERVQFFSQCHSDFSSLPSQIPIHLIVYNLGYLPGGDKKKTTMTETTLQSIGAAIERIEKEGAISITCYPGHEEGAREEKALLAFLENIAGFSICYHRWVNRITSPTLIWMKRILL